jgi:hypothetical protein
MTKNLRGKRDHFNVGAFQHSEHKCSGERDGQVNGTTAGGEMGEQWSHKFC